MSFIEELKRRNVVRVGIAYAVAAWIILQLTDVIGEIMELPAWGGKLILLMVVVGFFIALFLAWAFELTPEGIKRESEVDRAASITPQTGRRLDRAIIVLLVVALGYFVWESRFKGATEGLPDAPPADPAATATSAPQAATTPETTAADGKSIVVLPFVNMSADPDQEYFSDGLSEEILNALAQIQDLRVISRTSAFAFKGKDLSIPDIAAQLEVSHVLEGSVRTAGEQVRITAQLIEVDTDSHLWSQAYSRSIANVFEVQEEISLAIADELQLRLSEARPDARPTDNVEAYQLFLRGRHHYQARGPESLALAQDLLERAVALDPGFDEAWANLAATRLVMGFYDETDHDALYRQSLDAANRAIEINARNGLAHAVQGLLAFRDFDFERALEKLDQAIELNPNESNSYLWMGIVLGGLGYVDEAIAVMKRAEVFDPAFTNLHNWLADAYLARGDEAAALRHRDTALAIDPDYEFNDHAELMAIDGGMDARIQAVEAYVSSDTRPETRALVDAYVAALRDPAEREAAVDVIRAYSASDWRNPKTVWLYRLGAVEESLAAWRDMAASGRTLRAGNNLASFWSARYRDNVSHPAMAAFFEEFGLADHWRDHGDPDFCRRVGDRFECGDP